MCRVERRNLRISLRQGRVSFITVQLLIYLFVSLCFIAIAGMCLSTVITHFFQITKRLEEDIDLMMAIDFLRYDFWFKSISTAQVSSSAMSFWEKVDGKEKKVWYRVEMEQGDYVLKRVANDGTNVVYRSKKPISFYEETGIWGVKIGELCFDMVNATPSDVRVRLNLKPGELPYFLRPKQVDVSE